MRQYGTMVACALTVTAAVTVVACSADDGGFYNSDDGLGGGTPSVTASSGSGIGPGTGGMGGMPLPPEQELESSYGVPVATGNYVWVTNPDSGRVAFINATTLVIDVIDAGHAPTHLAAVPDPNDDVAIVLNVLSQDATVLRADPDGSLTAKSLPVPPAGNRWAVSSDGRWATAWTDARALEQVDPIDGYQDIAVLDLESDTSTPLTVGYRPVALGYDNASSRLFAVTADGISVITLDGDAPMVTQNIAISDDPLEDTSTRDVSLTPDGSYALVRRDGVETINVFSLSDGMRVDVVLSGSVTDLDLSPDGSVAVAVVRETSEVSLLPLPQIAADPTNFTTITVEDVVIGSVALAEQSPEAFLYTNAVPNSVLTVFDSSAAVPDPRSLMLHAPVTAVFPTQDAAHAVVLHNTLNQGSMYPAAMSLIPVAAQLPSKIVGLQQPLASLAIAPAGDRVLAATGTEADNSYEMLVAQLPSLKVERHVLASRPIAAGIVAGANRGFVAQEHPDGRISFVDFDDGEIRTLTGFELATEVVDGSKP